LVKNGDQIELMIQPEERYVGRAAMKLASVAEVLKIDFKDKLVLDVGSSTGGFTEFALKNGASKVVAVDVGSGQLHPSLRGDARVELHEKTDIRGFKMAAKPDLVLADLSFISLRDVLPSIGALSKDDTQIIVLLKPQFEAGKSQINRGVIKNETLRRQIIKEFETWVKRSFVIAAKADSEVAGVHGNRERFYSLRKLSKEKLPKPPRRAK
jgi:23S rRNA (cytidine1920-2'-O)/16S rRNA (cytidine1409-2'-O)-methyltransferase